MLKKCLIANRGEIAVRIIHACHELGIQAVAVYSSADENALFTQLADEAVWIGDAPPSQSYLNIDALIQVAQETDCDCVHPGYGFLSEAPAFAQAVIDVGLVWVGPPPSAIQTMGNKTEARTLMQAAGVPVVPGFQAEQATDEKWLSQAENIGYPVMVKASGGGGGKGIRVVQSSDDLLDSIQSAQREAKQAFGDPRIFLERYIEAGRHIEIQILADTHGNTLHLFERECSTQRRHQKIIEESPSPLLTDALRQQVGQTAIQAAQAVNYVNAGTIEFIATPDGDYYFLEMNTRLQVEHPVTEMVTGFDLAKLQLKIADGQSIPFTQKDIRQRGHAIECRIYAEDPHNQFLPSIGRIHQFTPPSGYGIRVDSGIQTGDDITIHYDPMIAKLIVYDHDRESAINRMRLALQQTVILGITSNLDFLLSLLDHPAFHTGEVHTRFVDDHLDDLLPDPTELDDLALVLAALQDYQGDAQTTPVYSASDGDVYSPWNRTDNFRIQ